MSDDSVFTYARGEHCLLVERATDRSGGPVAIGFIVGDTMVRKGVIVDRDKVGELFNALGAWLSEGDGQPYVLMTDDSRTRIFSEIHGEIAKLDTGRGTFGDESIDQMIDRKIGDVLPDLIGDKRSKFLRLATLAVSAIESIDRKAKEGH